VSFTVTYGEPEIASFMADFEARFALGSLSPAELRTFKKLVKLLALLSQNPRHPGLQSHEIKVLSSKYGVKIFESYLENNTPSAGRVFWFYDENVKGQIVFAGIEPHPEPGAYGRVGLSTETKKPTPAPRRK
jgi:hypothetical protein